MERRKTDGWRGLVLACLVALLAIGFVGCGDDDETTNNTSNNAVVNADEKVEKGIYTSDIEGYVIDDTGAAVVGARVYASGLSATTDANGYYMIEDVPITDYITVETGNATMTGVSIGQPNNENWVRVRVVPSEADAVKYPVAVVKVIPEMMHVENAGESGAGAGFGNSTSSGSTQPNSQTFYIKSVVPDCMLPHKAAIMTGTLRDVYTGQAVSGAYVSIQFAQLAMPANLKLNTNLIAVEQLEFDTKIAQTDSNGVFTVSNLPTSSRYNVSVLGMAILMDASGDSNEDSNEITAVVNVNAPVYSSSSYTVPIIVRSPNETENNAKANLYVKSIDDQDHISPFVITNEDSVTPYVDVANDHPNGDKVVYAQGIDGVNAPFEVKFSEPINSEKLKSDSISFFIFESSGAREITTTRSFEDNGATLVLQTSETLSEDTNFEIRMRRADFVDTSSNSNILWSVTNMENATNSDVVKALDNNDNWSELGDAPAGQSIYLVLRASTYITVSTDLPVLEEGTYSAFPDKTDGSPISSENLTYANLITNYENPAFHTVLDEYDGGPIYNLNFSADEPAMLTLARALTSSSSEPSRISGTVARIKFTKDSTVADYCAIIVDSKGTAVEDSNARIFLPDDTQTLINDDPDNICTPADHNELSKGGVRLVNNNSVVQDFLVELPKDEAGYKVKIYPLNDFYDLGQPAEIELYDNTPITTVINEPIYIGSGVDIMSTNNAGDAGDLVDVGEGSTGTGLPYLFARANMLAIDVDELGTGKLETLTSDDTNNLYKASNYSSFTLSRTIGIQISEKPKDANVSDVIVAYNTDGSPETSYITSATAIDLQGGEVKVIAATVSDIIKLQTLGTISIEGLADAAGNEAGDMAAVKIKDVMPPLMTEATFSGKTATFKFTEAVSIKNGQNFIVIGNAPTYTFSKADDIISVQKSTAYTDEKGNSANASRLKMTVDSNGLDGTLKLTVTQNYTAGGTTDANLDNYFSEVFDSDSAATETESQSNDQNVVDFTNVQDITKNQTGDVGSSWANANDDITDVPKFLAEDTMIPVIAADTSTLANSASPLTLDKAAQPLTLAIDDGAGNNINQGGSSWEAEPSGTAADETTTHSVRVTFREPIASGSTSGLYGTVTATGSSSSGSYAITKISVLNRYTIKVEFRKFDEAVAAGDKLEIKNITDASKNTNTITITLGVVSNGIALNDAAY